MHNRGSIRIKGYDYSQTGAYFITICAHEHRHFFGEIINGAICLNNYGEIIKNEWIKTAKIRKSIITDEFVVMPNHLHGIIIIDNHARRGTLQCAPTIEQFGKSTSNSIPTIIKLFKSTTAKQINELRRARGMSVWQRGFYEHIIRNEESLNKIREYIMINPLNWRTDLENAEYLTNLSPMEKLKRIKKHNEELYQ